MMMLSVKTASLAALVAIAALSVPALAQRDPAFDAARAAGQVGEKVDGYVGIVGTDTVELRRLVNDINIKRKAVFAERAQANSSTIEEYAFSIGCTQILKTQPGEKYQAPDGTWQTRTSAPPIRHPKCP
jgi:uncharacterized protein YdbL (DUF1318 family)